MQAFAGPSAQMRVASNARSARAAPLKQMAIPRNLLVEHRNGRLATQAGQQVDTFTLEGSEMKSAEQLLEEIITDRIRKTTAEECPFCADAPGVLCYIQLAVCLQMHRLCCDVCTR